MTIMSKIKTKTVHIAVAVTAVILFLLLALVGINFFTQKTVYISGLLEEKTLDDLTEQASLVAIGTVEEDYESFQIESVYGSEANYTDYEFVISSVLRGTSEEDSVTVRVQGGTVGNYTEIYEGSPDLEVEQVYLLFLYRPARGGSYNTKGDYYYVLGLNQGVFTENDGNYASQSGTTLPTEELLTMISEETEPVNENYFREEYISNQKINLENGFISQEEYDSLMENIDVYATILE